jgi:hypothetical protein
MTCAVFALSAVIKSVCGVDMRVSSATDCRRLIGGDGLPDDGVVFSFRCESRLITLNSIAARAWRPGAATPGCTINEIRDADPAASSAATKPRQCH